MDVLNNLAMRLNFAIRRHPSRWLYTDRMLGSYVDPHEAPYLTRTWANGPIWDVGASVGKYTAMLATSNPATKIFAFEPNLNSLYYLGYRTARFANVVIVPNALTADGGFLKGSYDPDFNGQATGPVVATISLRDATEKFGRPGFVKMDIEGGEYSVFESDEAQLLMNSTILVSWHPRIAGKAIPEVKGWKNTRLSTDISLLEPM